MSDAGVLKKGELTKRGGGFPYKWQERDFLLYSNKIEYYAKTVHKGTFPLNKDSTCVDASSEKPRAFKISTKEGDEDKDLLMFGATDALSQEWMTAINDCIKSLNGSTKAAPASIDKTDDSKKNTASDKKAEEEAKKKVAAEAKAAADKEREEKAAASKTANEEAKKKAAADKEAREEKAAADKVEREKKKAERENKQNTEAEIEEYCDQFGLGSKTLMSSQGKLLGPKFKEFIDSFTSDEVSGGAKYKLANQFATWVSLVSGSVREKKIKEFKSELIDLIGALANAEDDDDDYEVGDYKGKVHWASDLCRGLGTVCMMDQSQKVATLLAPLAYEAAENILDKEPTFNDTNAFVKENASTCRAQVVIGLINICPYTGNVKIPNAMDVVSRILCDDEYTDKMKQAAKSRVSSLGQVNKACMKNAGPGLIKIIVSGDGENDNLISSFASMPEMYSQNPDVIHKHLDYIFTINYPMICSLIYAIAQKHPRALIPYIDTLVEKLEENTQMGSLSLMALKEIAGVAPNKIFPLLDKITELAADVSHAGPSLSGIIGNAGKATEPKGAADQALIRLMKGIESCEETTMIPCWLQEIDKLRAYYSDKKVLKEHMPTLAKFKDSSPIIFTSIDDYASGRSLAVLTEKVDDLEAKVDALNSRVAESCKSYEDVIAYVDKNIRDVKDFVGEVVKKLPLPKRLEVIGTARKTLILHFECCRTKREYPIKSHEWNKWLKMGFSLAKSSKAIIDIGTGNPLGLLTTGADAVKGIYEAYKSKDDDEFNTYITNPFLTSAEQDGLINKLRDQGFFDKVNWLSNRWLVGSTIVISV